jgi:hypothetical protein
MAETLQLELWPFNARWAVVKIKLLVLAFGLLGLAAAMNGFGTAYCIFLAAVLTAAAALVALRGQTARTPLQRENYRCFALLLFACNGIPGMFLAPERMGFALPLGALALELFAVGWFFWIRLRFDRAQWAREHGIE